jgi:hypothetical protein
MGFRLSAQARQGTWILEAKGKIIKESGRPAPWEEIKSKVRGSGVALDRGPKRFIYYDFGALVPGESHIMNTSAGNLRTYFDRWAKARSVSWNVIIRRDGLKSAIVTRKKEGDDDVTPYNMTEEGRAYGQARGAVQAKRANNKPVVAPPRKERYLTLEEQIAISDAAMTDEDRDLMRLLEIAPAALASPVPLPKAESVDDLLGEMLSDDDEE